MNIIRCPKCKYNLISEESKIHECKQILDYKIEGNLVSFFDGERWCPSFFLSQPTFDRHDDQPQNGQNPQ